MSTLNADFDLADMVAGYIECAFWSSNDESREDGGDPLDKNYGPEDLDPVARAEMERDCRDFVATCTEAGIDLTSIWGRPADHIGHDFWLTRHHHGAGFWDRGLGDLGDRLTRIAHEFGERPLYVGDDGRVYSC